MEQRGDDRPVDQAAAAVMRHLGSTLYARIAMNKAQLCRHLVRLLPEPEPHASNSLWQKSALLARPDRSSFVHLRAMAMGKKPAARQASPMWVTTALSAICGLVGRLMDRWGRLTSALGLEMEIRGVRRLNRSSPKLPEQASPANKLLPRTASVLSQWFVTDVTERVRQVQPPVPSPGTAIAFFGDGTLAG